VDINIIVKDITALTNRVSALEQGFKDMGNEINSVKEEAIKAKLYAHEAADTSKEAVMLLTAAKGVGGFVAKHGPRFVAAIAGVLAYKGLIDTNLAAQLAGIFAT
jgi:hypothetical protein